MGIIAPITFAILQKQKNVKNILIEKHVKLKNSKGPDASSSIDTQELSELAADYALNFLKTGGSFCSKVFQGGTHQALLDILKKNFNSIKHYKPDASRKGSPENYVIAKGFRG